MSRTNWTGDDYEHGSVEASRATADNATKALGRLLDLLASKDLVDAGDIVLIVEGGNDYKKVELIDD